VNDWAGVRVLACGNIDRGDDGVGVLAAGMILPSLSEEGRRHVEIRRCGQLDIDHLLDVPAGTPILILDAAVGVAPGRVIRLSIEDLIAHPGGPTPHSSHALSVDQVLGIASVLAEAPLHGMFVGIGGAHFEYGEVLSEEVRAALPAYIDAIEAEIDRFVPAEVERRVPRLSRPGRGAG
jgi:hydrogenase maturation protease